MNPTKTNMKTANDIASLRNSTLRLLTTMKDAQAEFSRIVEQLKQVDGVNIARQPLNPDSPVIIESKEEYLARIAVELTKVECSIREQQAIAAVTQRIAPPTTSANIEPGTFLGRLFDKCAKFAG
jgi:hypothetical protein